MVNRIITNNHWIVSGGHKADEAQVLFLGGGHEPEGGQEPQEAEPCQRCQAEGGHQGERHPVLCVRVHEGEPVPADEGAL